MSLQGAIDDSLLRAHHIFLPEAGHISSQSIWYICGGGIAVAITYLSGEMWTKSFQSFRHHHLVDVSRNVLWYIWLHLEQGLVDLAPQEM